MTGYHTWKVHCNIRWATRCLPPIQMAVKCYFVIFWNRITFWKNNFIMLFSKNNSWAEPTPSNSQEPRDSTQYIGGLVLRWQPTWDHHCRLHAREAMHHVQQEQQLVPCGRRRGDNECLLTSTLFVTVIVCLPLMQAELTNMSPPISVTTRRTSSSCVITLGIYGETCIQYLRDIVVFKLGQNLPPYDLNYCHHFFYI
jgi:hypothetical protein